MPERKELPEAWADLKAALEKELLQFVEGLDRLLRRWPWLYRILGEPPEEQLRNMELYGRCRVCMAPRERETVVVEDDGYTRTSMSIVCPNGHQQP